MCIRDRLPSSSASWSSPLLAAPLRPRGPRLRDAGRFHRNAPAEIEKGPTFHMDGAAVRAGPTGRE
eukprot:7725466-Alexandrium_andersonii.AAC.1